VGVLQAGRPWQATEAFVGRAWIGNGLTSFNYDFVGFRGLELSGSYDAGWAFTDFALNHYPRLEGLPDQWAVRRLHHDIRLSEQPDSARIRCIGVQRRPSDAGLHAYCIAACSMIRLSTILHARVLEHDPKSGLTTLYFDGGEMRVPRIDAPVDSGVALEIDASDVAIALSRPMDVSITNRMPATIVDVELLDLPYARVTFALGDARLNALVTWESVERLALEPGLRAWAMIKTAAISNVAVNPARLPERRPPVLAQTSNLVKLPVRR